MNYPGSLPFLTVLFLGSALAAEPDPVREEARFLSKPRQLIFEGRRSGEGYFHPDGGRMVFQSEREEGNPFYQIYLLDLVSGETARVTPGTGKSTCAYFQAGTGQVLYSSTHLDPASLDKQREELEFRASGKVRRYAWDYDPSMELFSCQQDGTQLTRLTDSPGYDAEASFSPDGRQIVFCSLRSAYPTERLSAEDRARFEKDPAYFGEIYLMQSDGSGLRRLTHAPGYDGGPFFFPDGKRIVWRRFDALGMNADLYSMGVEESVPRRLTDFGCMSWAPFPHPSGRYIVFTSNKLGFENFELFLVDAEGTREPVRVTHTAGFDGLPVFSPDGRRLSWTSNRTGDGRSQIFLADWNHEEALKALEASPVRQSPGLGGGQVPGKAPEPEVSVLKEPGFEGVSASILAEDIRSEVSWLADPARSGRGTGTQGALDASAAIADYFARNQVGALDAGFFFPFSFDAGVRLVEGKNHLGSEGLEGGPWVVGRDFQPLPFSDSGEVEGEVVFAGYGLSVPEGNGQRYNSYDGLDVQGKIVLLFRYVPEGVDPQRRAQLNRYSGLRYKAMMARERGASAVLFVSGPNSPQAGDLVGMSGDGSLAGSGILAQSVSGKLAEALFKAAGKDLRAIQTGLDQENPHAESSFSIPKVRVKVGIGVEHLKGQDRNVLGRIEPGPGGVSEYVLVGAHYDHLGLGNGSSSMARAGEEGKVHPGADDNASGVAVVLELAAALAKKRAEQPGVFRRGVIFGLWSGEEMGLVGSAGFVEKPSVDLSRVAAYLNFDMVGRLREDRLTLQGVGSSKVWKRLVEKRNVAAGFSLVLQDDPYLPTDTTSFYPRKIPVLNFFTGAHEDYHRPTDTAEKLNYDGAARIAQFAEGLVLDLVSAAERPDFARVERSDKAGGSRETLRAYLGTIPDYATEVKGVKISGVRGGSPAEKSGLAGGDVIVEFGGQKITNIYDYTYALDAVKIGVAVKVTVERGGQRMEFSVVPEARK